MPNYKCNDNQHDGALKCWHEQLKQPKTAKPVQFR